MKKLLPISIIIALGLTATVASGYATGIWVQDGNSNSARLLPITNDGSDDGKTLFVNHLKKSGLELKDPSLFQNPVIIPFLSTSTPLTNLSAASSEVGVAYRTLYNFTNATQARIVLGVMTAGSAGSKVSVEFLRNGQGYWLDGTIDATTTPSAGFAPIDQVGVQSSEWVTLPNGAKQDLVIKVVGFGGNGVADPKITNMSLQVRWNFSNDLFSGSSGNASAIAILAAIEVADIVNHSINERTLPKNLSLAHVVDRNWNKHVLMKKGAIIAVELTVIFSLVSIIYGILNRDIDNVKADVVSVKTDVVDLKDVHQTLDLKMQNMAANIYLLCQSAKQKCIPPND